MAQPSGEASTEKSVKQALTAVLSKKEFTEATKKESTLSKEEQEEKDKLRASEAGKPLQRFKFDGTAGDRTISVSFSKQGLLVDEFSFELEMAPSAELLPEEIVTGKKREPWISKVAFDDVVFEGTDAELIAETRPKIYVNIGGDDRKRVLGDAVITITGLNKESLSLTYKIRYEEDKINDPLVNGVVRLSDESFAVSINGTLKLSAE